MNNETICCVITFALFLFFKFNCLEQVKTFLYSAKNGSDKQVSEYEIEEFHICDSVSCNRNLPRVQHVIICKNINEIAKVIFFKLESVVHFVCSF